MPSTVLTRSVEERQRLTVWAAACAARALPLFEDRVAGDGRPREAVAGADAFARGEIRVGMARALAVAALEAARQTDDRAARAAARAAGHAIATAHLAGHARHAAAYAADAVALAHPDDAEVRRLEQSWQHDRLPPDLRRLVDPDPLVPNQRTRPDPG